MEETRNEAVKTTYFSLTGNVILAVIKGLTGYFGNSYALIADAIESVTDVISSTLVLFGIKYATKPPDENHPYGHGKAEPLITFIVVGFLIISATIIASKSIENIRTPHQVPESYTLIVLGAIVIIKEIFYRRISKKGRETNSTALTADAWHHRSDAITSSIAFVGILIAIVMGPGYESADDWAALFASGIIGYNAYLIFRPALGEIMDEHLHDDIITDIREQAAKVEGVIDTEKCHVRKAGIYFHIDLHLIVDGNLSVRSGHGIAHEVKDRLQHKFPEVIDILIHVEPAEPQSD